MCGRYHIDISVEEIQQIVEEIQRQQRQRPEYEQLVIKLDGDIFPTDVVPVRTGVQDFAPMRWGFTDFKGKPMINARSETALEKPTFRQSLLERRCLIPASSYYEWQTVGKSKVKYRFSLPDQTLYLAGCYRQERDEPVNRFVILTQAAWPEFAEIHNRMPVLVTPEQAERWFTGDGCDLSSSPAEFYQQLRCKLSC